MIGGSPTKCGFRTLRTISKFTMCEIIHIIALTSVMYDLLLNNNRHFFTNIAISMHNNHSIIIQKDFMYDYRMIDKEGGFLCGK
jgi:hypothetical protein